LAFCLVTLGHASVAAAQSRWQIGFAPSYSSGRYEGDTPTSVIYTPLIARRLFADGDLTLAVPWTCIEGEGGVTVVNGMPVRSEPRPGSTGSERGTASDSPARAGAAPVPPVSACGLGDIIVRGRYYLVDERGWLPTLALRAHLKTPTASARRGLGTGRPDAGIGAEISRAVTRTFRVMADGGYTAIGNPRGVTYQDTWWYDVGVARDLANGRLNLSLFFEEYRALLPGGANARDLLATVMLGGATDWRVQVSGQFGLSEGAPDHALIVGASRRF
jgi:hypothetical protein